jgi:hypothetical protein
MRPNQGYPENWIRTSSNAQKKHSLCTMFLFGLASFLLAIVLFEGERAEGQSELASVTSSDPNPSLSSPTGPSGAEQTAANSAKQAESANSLLFSAFRSASADVVLPPQSPGQKISRGLFDSVAPSSFIFTAVEAGVRQADKKYPAFRQGAAGYGRYYWHDFADQASQKLLVESFLPIVFHDDNRYYRLGRGSFVHRTGYALSRLVVTRDDRGQNTLNLPEIIGTGAAAGISCSYYPHHYSNWTETGQRWAFNAAFDGGIMVVREFWPEFSHTVLRIRH